MTDVLSMIGIDETSEVPSARFPQSDLLDRLQHDHIALQHDHMALQHDHLALQHYHIVRDGAQVDRAPGQPREEV